MADVIHWGTADGARIVGLGEGGKLAPDYAADLVVYRLDDPRYFGLRDPLSPVYLK